MIVVESYKMKVVDVLYGSVNGNAEEIARRIHSELPQHSFESGKFQALCEFDSAGFANESTRGDALIIVTSTTGDGDLPANAMKFPRQLKKIKEVNPKALESLNYCVLGLGDTNYENFNNAARRVDKLLKGAGAKAFYYRGEADDGVGLESVVEPWLEGLYPALSELLLKSMENGKHDQAIKQNIDVAVEAEVKKMIMEEMLTGFEGLPVVLDPLVKLDVFSEIDFPENITYGPCLSEAVRDETVYEAAVVGARLLTDPELTDRRVWHMEVDLSESNVKYSPGDSIAIVVENVMEDIDFVVKHIEFPEGFNAESFGVVKSRESDRKVLAGACPLKDMLKRLVDFHSPLKKTCLRALAEYCTDEKECKSLLNLSSKTGRNEYSSKVKSGELGFLSILKDRPSCRPPLELVIDQLPRLVPRYYSASSAYSVDGSVFHFAFSVVHVGNSGRRGLATGMLEDLCRAYSSNDSKDLKVELVVRQTGHFSPPEDPTIPYLMIGPGTGVAPFRGFLRDRRARGLFKSSECGEVWLLFGCRHEAKDFLYGDELKDYAESGELDQLVTAFSRDNWVEGNPKVYVQHKIIEYAEQIGNLLMNNDKSRIYVCGDGGNMASEVQQALIKVIGQFGNGMSESDAAQLLKEWGHAGRYLRDVWYWN